MKSETRDVRDWSTATNELLQVGDLIDTIGDFCCLDA